MKVLIPITQICNDSDFSTLSSLVIVLGLFSFALRQAVWKETPDSCPVALSTSVCTVQTQGLSLHGQSPINTACKGSTRSPLYGTRTWCVDLAHEVAFAVTTTYKLKRYDISEILGQKREGVFRKAE